MAKCKYCQAELPENTTVCPACGKDNKEEKKMTPGRIALVVAAVVVLAALVVALVYAGMNVVVTSEEQTEAAVETAAETEAPATIPANGNPDDETAKGTYTASDADVIAAKDTVVAKVGDTGNTTGPHLHFELKRDGEFLDPQPYIDDVTQ